MTETNTIRLPHVPAWRSWSPREVLESCPLTGRPLTAILSDGTRAEYMRTEFDCFRCTLATLARAPYDDVPGLGSPGDSSLALTQAIADMGAWAHGLGCRLVWHEKPPVDRERWIGSVPADAFGRDHGVVMSKSFVIHDPAAAFPLPEGRVPVHVTLADIKWGLTLEPLEGC